MNGEKKSQEKERQRKNEDFSEEIERESVGTLPVRGPYKYIPRWWLIVISLPGGPFVVTRTSLSVLNQPVIRLQSFCANNIPLERTSEMDTKIHPFDFVYLLIPQPL